MKKISLILIALLVLSGCSSNTQEPVASEVTITHELGTTVVPTNPEKVVIFDMGILDTYDELGLSVYALPKSNVPSLLSKYEGDEYLSSGEIKEPDIEAIYEMEPDLIIISGRVSDYYDQLTEIAPTIYLGLNTDDFTSSVVSNLEILAQIYPSSEDKINEEITSLKSDIAGLKEKASKLTETALFVLVNGDSLSTFGTGSRFGMVYDDFGFTQIDATVDASTHGQSISFEYLAEENPGIMIVMDRGQIVGSETTAQTLLDNSLVNGTDAAKNDKIVYVDPEVWYLMTGGLNATKVMIKELSVLVD